MRVSLHAICELVLGYRPSGRTVLLAGAHCGNVGLLTKTLRGKP